ncbi:hypothetical protein POMI540_3456 [Schizosaccharomyces pombe]|uniref:Vacuolar protein sorting-associated protein 28 homolog n=1 Tax=Schizosaccharomyces pombe (strain 972 / ATCC 24843) TaxID=284812 RepID=VPS28_SCHPO|nr:ESCRT I complex subunit Vps28 [Schizosaccharomyces pombe]O13872.1 RecName: Full=Vacuolar protein sorting-associated protein 28 homolog; AltName: Full=ESCRT-I complex subunit vps28 [Schizosaccharomyces pombe 972h-]CAB11236.1 ESCRT I complex subunit Vps28 [Schizosaccharomyces pombe]|eukprot:NP_594791.1 ESCRT I complex subunit Vps28 [Schizosaccharomyces pombe]
MTEYYDLNLLEKETSEENNFHTKNQQVREDLSILYSILVALEQLEKAFTKDAVSTSDFNSTCELLIQQWESCFSDERVTQAFGSFEDFCSKYRLQCPRAIKRIQEGISDERSQSNSTFSNAISTTAEPSIAMNDTTPQTVNPTKAPSNPSASIAKSIAGLVQNFITTLDAIRLNFIAKDQLHPLLSELIVSMDDLTESLKIQVSCRNKLVQWLIKINNMNITDQLNDVEKRELLYDLEQAYAECYSLL